MMFSVKIAGETVEQLSTNTSSGLAGITSQVTLTVELNWVAVVGPTVSIILIVCVAVEAFPQASFAVQVRVSV